MNEGKLAVVLGVEVSLLFDCTTTAGQPNCDEAQIDRQLEEVYDLGVRQMELVNKFDNALSGVAGDAGTTGVLVNGANFLETGSFWRFETCDEDEDHAHDRTYPNVSDEAGLPPELAARDALAGVVLNAVGGSGLAPAYAAGPHCNKLGLSDLGAHTIERMAERGMLFDPDHMSAKARDEAMTLIEERGYSGVMSSHSWSDAGIYERIQTARWGRHPDGWLVAGLRRGVAAAAVLRRRPVLLRDRLRQRRERVRHPGWASRPRDREPGDLPVPRPRRDHDPPAGLGRTDLRHQHRRGRSLRALPGLGGGPAPARR